MDIHVVTAETPPLKNLDRAIKNAHLGLRSLVASPLAASLATLDREERQLGVALVEIGAGVTTVAVHSRGMLVGVASIPMGASDITADIASTFAIRLSDAERIKVLEAAAISTSRDASDLIDLPPIDEDAVGEAAQVPRAQLIAVVRQRLDMIFAAVETRLGALGFNGPRARQVVLTGGGAELRGMADYAQGVLGRNVRIGRPTGLAGLPQAQSSPAFSTLAGLVLFAAADEPDIWHSAAVGPARQKTGFMAAFDRLIRGF
jgi:cell division protein FtsA